MINTHVNKDNICLGRKQDDKAIVRYCCEYSRRVLKGAVDMGIRKDDFWGSFIPTFVGLENHTRAAELAGTAVHFNHQFSGCKCDGSVNIDFNVEYIEKIKYDISYHLERLENNRVVVYYIKSLLGDIKNSKNIDSFNGLTTWLKVLLKKAKAKKG